jgi:hypothetical protein
MNDKYLDLIQPEFKESYLLYKAGKQLKAYSSHQPLLIHVLNTINTGNVVEFGMGFHSTPLMHTICTLQGRNLLSVDNEEEWMNKFTKYKSKLHRIELMKDIPAHTKIKMKLANISIALVDGGLPRQPFINLMYNNADYIIVHDTELYVERKKEDIYHYDFSMFKHVHHFKYKNSYPMTSLLSNLDVIDEKLLTIF